MKVKHVIITHIQGTLHIKYDWKKAFSDEHRLKHKFKCSMPFVSVETRDVFELRARHSVTDGNCAFVTGA